jgi:hypothetical protein
MESVTCITVLNLSLASGHCMQSRFNFRITSISLPKRMIPYLHVHEFEHHDLYRGMQVMHLMVKKHQTMASRTKYPFYHQISTNRTHLIGWQWRRVSNFTNLHAVTRLLSKRNFFGWSFLSLSRCLSLSYIYARWQGQVEKNQWYRETARGFFTTYIISVVEWR